MSEPVEPIPLFRPTIPPRSEWWMLYERALQSGYLTNFGQNYRLAQKLLNEMHGGHWVIVTNGTVAIEVALQTRLKTRSSVLVPDFTFAATINAVARSGHNPLIVPCEAETFQMKPSVVDTLLYLETHPKTSALLVVAPFGYSIDFQMWEKTAQRHGVDLVYDLAGAWPLVPPSGTACYSLHAAKSMPVGEGGLVRFQTQAEAEAAERLINFSFDGQRFPQSLLGMNGKMDELHCSILIAQLRNQKRIEQRIHRIKQNINEYQDELRDYVVPTNRHLLGAPSICALKGFKRPDELVKYAGQRGVVLRRYFWPLLSEVPVYNDCAIEGAFSSDDLRTVVALPTDTTAQERERVVDIIQAHQVKFHA